jgi:hypothetical protein
MNLMNNVIIYTIVGIILVVSLYLILRNKKEGLSLSQFPVPTCSTCKSCKFYTCGGCDNWYQLQNQEGQPCDCGGFPVYRTALSKSCLNGKEGLTVGQPALVEFVNPENPTDCAQAAGTFDGGSTFMRDLPCPVPFPRVGKGLKLVAHKQSRHVSEADIYNHLEQGGLIIGANEGSIADYALSTLMKESTSNEGYPNFYYIKGPVVILTKLNNTYFWMIDYPIKYNPINITNYINISDNWGIAKTMYQTGRKLLNSNAPFFFFSYERPEDYRRVCKTAFACLPEGQPQSNTDYYKGKCATKSCLWGSPYGDGNWTERV